MVIYDSEKQTLYIPTSGDKVLYDDIGIKMQKAFQSGYTNGFEKGVADAEKACYTMMPLTFEILSAGTVSWNLAGKQQLQYSLNGGEWTTMDSNTVIDVQAGDEIKFIGYLYQYSPGHQADVSVPYNVKGNIMSLVDEVNFDTLTTTDMLFRNMFAGQPVISAEKLILPVTTAIESMCERMFSGCTSLIAAPELPATTLAYNCYFEMFRGCTSLTSAPELPATMLADSCYRRMFMNCTSLTSAPELPATTLVNSCYSGMFDGCASLTTAPELPATILAQSCYNAMFANCTSLTTAPELPATTLAQSCYGSMFSYCTSLTSAPELPATILAQSCYNAMFINCTSLTTAPELPATTLANRCYYLMFTNCTSLTTAPELPATTLVQECYQQMFLGCRNLNYIKCFATDISATNCTKNWVVSVAPFGTFVKATSADWSAKTDTDGIPINWVVTNNG